MTTPTLVERIENVLTDVVEGRSVDPVRVAELFRAVRELQEAATFARNAIGVCDSRCRQCLRCETDERLAIALTKTGAI